VKGYTKSDGTKVKGHWRNTDECKEKSKGLSGPIPPLSKDTLGQYGYSDIRRKTAGDRREALKKAINGYSRKNSVTKREASLAVFRRLNAIATLKKNTLPKDSVLHKRDANWIKREYL